MTAPDLQELERMIDRGETAAALSILAPAVRREPAHAAAHVLLARAYEGEGLLDESVTAWRAARLLVPDSRTAASGLQRALRLRLLRAVDPMLQAVAESVDLDYADDAVTSDDGASGTDAPAPPATDAPEEPEPDMAGPEAAAADETVPEATAPEVEPVEPTQDLDELIRELEAARIVPDPTIRLADADDIEPDVDDVVSETLARIYANQHHFDEAARVYEQLARQRPDRSDEFMRMARELRGKAES